MNIDETRCFNCTIFKYNLKQKQIQSFVMFTLMKQLFILYSLFTTNIQRSFDLHRCSVSFLLLIDILI